MPAPGERPLSSEPATLARAATRAELRNPGTLERSFQGGAPGFGSMVGSSLIGTVAGYVIGSALVSAFLPWDAGYDANADGGVATSGPARHGDASRRLGDAGADFGGSRLRRLRLLASAYGQSSDLMARRSSIAA